MFLLKYLTFVLFIWNLNIQLLLKGLEMSGIFISPDTMNDILSNFILLHFPQSMEVMYFWKKICLKHYNDRKWEEGG